jgi:hypothetical protein
VSPGFILPFCRYRPVQADAGLPAWSSLPTELEWHWAFSFSLFLPRCLQSEDNRTLRFDAAKDKLVVF